MLLRVELLTQTNNAVATWTTNWHSCPVLCLFLKHTAKHKNDSFNSISLYLEDCNLLLLSFWEKICPIKTNLKTLWTQNDRWPDASHVVGGTFFICFVFWAETVSVRLGPKDHVRVGVDRFSRIPSESPITSEQRWRAERVQNYFCSGWFWLVMWSLLMLLFPLVSVSRLFGCLLSQHHRGDFHARSNAIATFDIPLVGKTSIIRLFQHNKNWSVRSSSSCLLATASRRLVLSLMFQ